MTRRLSGRGRTLTIDGYIHRATLGLPKAGRLDAAAELRTHLMERAAEHEAQGFSPEEAEYLAVKGMGEPQPVNRSLLGHAFTHRAGWAALALMMVVGVGWYAWREWLPPPVGVTFGAATPDDITSLFAITDAPRGDYMAATLTYPRGTRSVVRAVVDTGAFRAGMDFFDPTSKSVSEEEKYTLTGRIPGSYRYQERLLLTTRPMTCGGRETVAIYGSSRILPSRFWNGESHFYSGFFLNQPECSGLSMGQHMVVPLSEGKPVPGVQESRPTLSYGGGVTAHFNAKPTGLKLNQWTVLMRLNDDPSTYAETGQRKVAGVVRHPSRSLYLAVLPLDRDIKQNYGSYRVERTAAGVAVYLQGQRMPLPKLPEIRPTPYIPLTDVQP